MSEKQTFRIKAILSDGTVKALHLNLSLDTNAGLWELQLEDLEGHPTSFRETDIYKAMQTLREYLEAKGCQLLCAGARPDVAPSGMSRSMGGGGKAYVMQMGKQATELVDIFDYAEPGVVGTVKQQREFVETWFASLPRPSESNFSISAWLKKPFAKPR
jgi:hypothetical protein